MEPLELVEENAYMVDMQELAGMMQPYLYTLLASVSLGMVMFLIMYGAVKVFNLLRLSK